MVLVKQLELGPNHLGRGKVLMSWHSSSNLLAVYGANSKVMIVNREGKPEYQFTLSSVMDMRWAGVSDVLALVAEHSTAVHLYTHKTRNLDNFNTGLKDMCLVRWSRNGVDLVVGTRKGTFVLYNRSTMRKLPIVGTHSQSIVDAVWTFVDGLLVMIGADRVLSVSNAEGNVLHSIPLNGTPTAVTLLETTRPVPPARTTPFSATPPTTTTTPNTMSMVSAVVGGGAVAVVNLSSKIQLVHVQGGETVTVQFDADVGLVMSISSCSSLSCVFGFSSGVVALGVLHDRDLVLTARLSAFRDAVRCVSYGEGSGLTVAVGDNAVRAFTKSGDRLDEVKESAVQFELEPGSMSQVAWSPDGQNVAVSTVNGNVYAYTLKVLNIGAACGSLVFYFVSARVVGVKNVREGKVLLTIPIDMDPTFMAAGMGMLAVGAGNSVMYYEYYIPNTLPPQLEAGMMIAGASDSRNATLTPAHANSASNREPRSSLVRRVDYPAAVNEVRVCSHFAAVLYDGQIQLHPVGSAEARAPVMTYPPPGEGKAIGLELAESLFLYATARRVVVISLLQMQPVAEYTARTGLRRVFPNATCTRVAFVDENNVLYVLNTVTDVSTQAEGFEPEHHTVLWDLADPNIFVSYGSSQLTTFVCSPHSRHGPTCESILVRDSGTENMHTALPTNYKPLSLFRGMVIAQSPTGLLDTIPLRSHHEIGCRSANAEAFYNNFSLNRLRWASQNISSPSEAEDLAVKALHMLDIELAIRVYRQLSQPSLVLCLEKIKHIHEKNLLIGHVCMIMGYFKDAQASFLRSSRPLCALEMRRDLMQWEPALALAKELAEGQVPIISAEYAQQLEYRGEYAKALEMYKNGQRAAPTGHAGTELTAAQEEVQTHNAMCEQGVARCQFRLGNMDEAMAVALHSDDLSFVTECAKLCEDIHRYDEAAQLYEKSGDVERAASLHIERGRNLKAAARLMPKVRSRNILVLFAKAKEAEGAFAEAEKAYTQAEDWDNVVRLKVEKLNDLHGAYSIVRRTRSVEAASTVAKTCQQRGDFGMAVEFLVLAKCITEAFDLAVEKGCMPNFENVLLSQVQLKNGVAPLAQQGDFAMIADYHDKAKKPGQAAMYYHVAGNFAMALKKYLEAGEPEDIDKAVEVVGKAHSDSLTNKLIDFLMGEGDGEPKDPSYIFKLYMALGSYEKAAKTSVIIATKEQEMGNYKSAHHTLLEACRLLREKQLRVPNDLRRTLMLLHSYIIVKDLIKVMHDEETACRMLLRVSRNIQRFPMHIPAIVTSTVMQCVKSGFKKSAFEFACLLIQNEKYRVELNEKNRRKIEGVVRRRGRETMEDPQEKTSACPFCDAPVAETELDCGACKNTLPFCIVTGKHIVKADFAVTPCCHFPALYSALLTRLREVSTCPLCEATLDANKIERVSEPDLKEYV